MYHSSSFEKNREPFPPFDFSEIIKNDVLYLYDDGSLNDDSLAGGDDILWAEWRNSIIRKIVIGRECSVFPVELLAEHRDNRHSGDYEIEVDSENPYFLYHDGAIFDKTMHKLVFFTRKFQETYTIPEGVVKIGESAFENCVNLRSVSIPKTVSEIEVNAFTNCSSLVSLEIPETVLVIEEDAFCSVPHIFYNGSACSTWGECTWGAQRLN